MIVFYYIMYQKVLGLKSLKLQLLAYGQGYKVTE